MDIKEKIEQLTNHQREHWKNLLDKLGFGEEDDWLSLLEDWRLSIETQTELQIEWINFVSDSIINREDQTKRMVDWAAQFRDMTINSTIQNQKYWVEWIEEMKNVDPSTLIEDKDYDNIIKNWQNIIQEAYNSNVNWIKLWKN